MCSHTVHVHGQEMGVQVYGEMFYEREQIYNTTSSRHIRRYGSFQYEGPQVPQVTYGEGKKGNAGH